MEAPIHPSEQTEAYKLINDTIDLYFNHADLSQHIIDALQQAKLLRGESDLAQVQQQLEVIINKHQEAMVRGVSGPSLHTRIYRHLVNLGLVL